MYTKKQGYIPLESQEYVMIQRPATRIILGFLVFIQLIILTQWIFTLFEKSHESIRHLSVRSSENRDVIFVSAEYLKEYDDEHTGWEGNECVVTANAEKFDCYPETGASEDLCRKRKCCWEPVNNKKYLGVPWCYYPKNYGGYKVVNMTDSHGGVRVFLNRTFPSPYPDDVKLVRVDIQSQSDSILHIKIVDAEVNRYEPPYPEIPIVSDPPINPQYQVRYLSNGFKVYRIDDENPLFDSSNVGGFIFADQFLQLSSKFSGKIYGLGEHQANFELDTNWTRFTMFNRDGIPMPEANLYGSHPFYLVMEPNGKSHGVFFHNSNAMDILLQPLPAITFRSIGGVFDFYVFTGPTPADVIKQYTEIIGRTFFPPYWSLGFHLSRYGYKNTSDIRAVWKRTRDAKIPFDTQWHDIDYMDRRNDFTIDAERYGDLPEFVKEIHDAGMRYVMILDPGVSGCEPNGTYPPYDEGIEMDVFIKNEDGSVFVGKVWNPNCTVFPDFTAPNATFYWSEQIRKFHDIVPFDGIWIDMNEPSNFLDGSFKGCSSNKWEDPIFTPDVLGGKLRKQTVCMSAQQAAGSHYNLHNLYGFTEAIATNEALKELKKRPFIISRSTYPGIGRFAGHWSGDVVSTWHAMKLSIPKMLSFSLFGIPMMGADICGFNGNTTAKLCQRWSQLGAFYPFSRNHNSDDCIAQDPVALGEDVVNATRKALTVRYTLLPYLYTLFYKAHVYGETVARPLFFEFWNDPRTHNLDESFLWGCCLLIVPVLQEYATTVKTYLPAARWYDWYTGLGEESNGTEVTLPAGSDTIPVLIRGGGIIPTQAPNLTTTLSRLNGIELIVASNKSQGASGCLYWDDGESLDTYKTGEYGIVEFILTPQNLTSHVTTWGYHEVPKLSSIKILGFVKPIRELYFNNKTIEFKWNPTSLILFLEVNHPINVPFVVKWKRVGE